MIRSFSLIPILSLLSKEVPQVFLSLSHFHSRPSFIYFSWEWCFIFGYIHFSIITRDKMHLSQHFFLTVLPFVSFLCISFRSRSKNMNFRVSGIHATKMIIRKELKKKHSFSVHSFFTLVTPSLLSCFDLLILVLLLLFLLHLFSPWFGVTCFKGYAGQVYFLYPPVKLRCFQPKS